MANTVAVVGLGYVGLPLAVAFGKQMPAIGFDLNEQKLDIPASQYTLHIHLMNVKSALPRAPAGFAAGRGRAMNTGQ